MKPENEIVHESRFKLPTKTQFLLSISALGLTACQVVSPIEIRGNGLERVAQIGAAAKHPSDVANKIVNDGIKIDPVACAKRLNSWAGDDESRHLGRVGNYDQTIFPVGTIVEIGLFPECYSNVRPYNMSLKANRAKTTKLQINF